MPDTMIDRKLVAELTEREEKRLEKSTPKSYELYQRAIKHMPMGVASTYHARDPYPVYFTHGKGPHIWTVDGQEIADFHNGYGCMVQGHAQPGHRRGDPEARPARHAVRPADRRRHHHGRAPLRRLQAAAVALRQLGLRGHDGRHPRGPRLHRP